MRIIVLFNLRPDVRREDYEDWARGIDMPAVRSLASVSGFEVFEATHVLGSDATPAYRYIEIIDVGDPDGFGGDVGSEKMQAIAAEFQKFADDPQFIVTRNLDDRG